MEGGSGVFASTEVDQDQELFAAHRQRESWFLMLDCKHCEMLVSTLSPAMCPWLSLSLLKWSMSSMMTPDRVSAITLVKRSSPLRFNAFVRGSVVLLFSSSLLLVDSFSTFWLRARTDRRSCLKTKYAAAMLGPRRQSEKGVLWTTCCWLNAIGVIE